MKVNLAVSGKFHFHNYVRYLAEKGVLNRFYYAHKISTNAGVLGVPADQLVNIWLKEYLLQAHSMYLSRFGSEVMKPFYRGIWEYGAAMKWVPGDLLHIMLHGGGRRLIGRARGEGSLVIGEPVNAHPDIQNEILNTEAERLKIRRSHKMTRAQKSILEEVGMADRLLVASNFLKRSYVQKGYPEDLVTVLPYGVDLSRFSFVPNDQVPDKFRVVCVAGISIRKGIIDLLDAWKILGLANAELLLIGRVSTEMIPIMKQYEGLYRHIPFVPNSELKECFGNSSVFVLPSLEDGFGLVCSEAMACGLPVIATRNTGAAELIDEGVSGYVVPIRSPESIAEKLSILCEDREKAKSMGVAAAEKVRTMYGWDGYADKLIEYYNDALA